MKTITLNEKELAIIKAIYSKKFKMQEKDEKSINSLLEKAFITIDKKKYVLSPTGNVVYELYLERINREDIKNVK